MLEMSSFWGYFVSACYSLFLWECLWTDFTVYDYAHSHSGKHISAAAPRCKTRSTASSGRLQKSATNAWQTEGLSVVSSAADCALMHITSYSVYVFNLRYERSCCIAGNFLHW